MVDDGKRCLVCAERPARSPVGDPVCGSCRSAISRLRRLDGVTLRLAVKRATARLNRIIAARRGLDHVVKTQL